MIVCDKRKIAIFLVPKTGTITLNKIFQHANVTENKHLHTNYEEFLKQHPDKQNYKFYAFYRDPIDRFLSGLRYVKRSKSRYPLMLQKYYGSNIQISCISRKEYHELDQDLREKIEAISFDWIIENWDFINDLAFKEQVYWLDHKGIQLLNYSNYSSEIQRLTKEFDFTIDIIPNENASVKKEHDVMSDKVLQFVYKNYKKDFEFLQ